MNLKDIRLSKGLTQVQASKLLGISRRTYINYEKNETQIPDIKYDFLCKMLDNYALINEEHGILSLEQIKTICEEVFQEYNIEYGYLFGSYAKGKAKETSDVNLLVSSSLTGLKFFELVETLREKLKNKVDMSNLAQLNNNIELVK